MKVNDCVGLDIVISTITRMTAISCDVAEINQRLAPDIRGPVAFFDPLKLKEHGDLRLCRMYDWLE